MSDLRMPLTPPDCDLRDFQRMMIDISRLRQSSFDAVIDDSAWRAGVNLWFSAWHAIPAGSLENEDGALAKAAGLGRDVKTWRKVKKDALRGFVECDDGRLYHETVCEFALEAWIEKLVQRISSGAGNAKRWKSTFDATPIEAMLSDAADRLAAIAPDSKSLAKARRRESRTDAAAIPPERADNPTGTISASHRDQEIIPPGSQEIGTGTGTGKKEGSEAVASAAAAEPPLPVEVVPDPMKIMFDSGIAMLATGGMPAQRARPLLGKWRSQYGTERVIAAIGNAKREGAIEPAAFIERCLRNGGANGSGTGNPGRRTRADDIDDAARDLGFGR